MKNLIISFILHLYDFLIKYYKAQSSFFMKKITTLFSFALIFCMAFISPLTAGPLTDLLLELNALSEFNAKARGALYKSVATAFSSSNNSDYEQDNRSAREKVQENLDKPFTFEDLGGDISPDIKEVIEFMSDPERFARVGAKMPRGVLLYGPPGTGKTSLARAIAGESGAEFFSASGSEFIEMYVGVGPMRVRELFEKAKACKKAIVFIDEIDAIGGKRSGETNSEYRNTLNELLKQMDGFERSNITVIAATNRVEDLDEALLRPGRFDRLVEVGLPNLQSRIGIFKLYCKKITFKPANDDIFIELAQKSPGFSGADIKNVINEAAVFAARENSDSVNESHVRQALEKEIKKKRRVR